VASWVMALLGGSARQTVMTTLSDRL
jgi:hypothetical protein